MSSYKYLGVILSDNGSFKLAISTLANQANKALFSLMRTVSNLAFPSPSLICTLFDSLVRPIAEYGSEVWGYSQADDLEILHRKFCKFVLGVPRSTTNLACYGELARFPLAIRRKVAVIKYWLRISCDWTTPALVKDAYELAKESSLEWVNFVKKTLDSTGFSQIWSLPSGADYKLFSGELEQRLTDHFIQSWQSDLRNTTGKLRAYKLVKDSFQTENYLDLPAYLRVPMARLRSSSHSLRIETGRYCLPSPCPADERFCWFCEDGSVEDELHFLFHCPLYNRTQMRKDFMDYCRHLNSAFPYISGYEKWKFISLSSDKKLTYLFCKFVSKAFELRRSLL